MKVKHLFITAYIALSVWALWYLFFVPFVGTFSYGSKYEKEFAIEGIVIVVNLNNFLTAAIFFIKNWNKNIYKP